MNKKEMVKDLLELEEKHKRINVFIEENKAFCDLTTRQQHLLVELRATMEVYFSSLCECIDELGAEDE